MIKVADNKLQFYNYETDLKKHELSQLSQEVSTKKNFIQNFDNEEGFIRIKEVVRKEAEFLLKDNRQILAIVIFAAIETQKISISRS